MTTTQPSPSSSTPPTTIQTDKPGVPFTRLVQVELRKMFDTRSGFWLMASILIMSALATLAVILFAPDSEITYALFGGALGTPMAILLPVVAILAVTSEWSQRSGLITFTLSPNRGAVIGAKAVAAIIVAIVSVLLAFGIAAIGNVIGATVNGLDPVWDMDVSDLLLFILGNILGLLIGFMLGVLMRNPAAAIVGYLVYSLVLPGLLSLLAALQEWFRDLQPWVDFGYAQTPLIEGGSLSGEEWGQLGTSGLIWFVIPMAIGVWAVLRSEVK